ncbi:hypothetical protein IU469_31965 [Nocardia puris]|uniref:hypothetical protein n=1 Tax=Nocardia puris TaxID=208602 RepID=UPI000836CCFC|nr:hypothetical protein [Nocardia puris]MBF6215937.1 hypothetical protein [Nocardia puris]MBF6370289.1 hypothetical protein [Nocardia puris]
MTGQPDSVESPYSVVQWHWQTYTLQRQPYTVVALASGVRAEPSARIIARAAVDVVVDVGGAVDFLRSPDRLVEIARVVVGMFGAYASDSTPFWDFIIQRDPTRAPDIELLVVTATIDGTVCLAWAGRWRAVVLTRSDHVHELDLTARPPHAYAATLSQVEDADSGLIHRDPAREGDQPALLAVLNAVAAEVLPTAAIGYALRWAPDTDTAAAWLRRWARRLTPTTSPPATHAIDAMAVVLSFP